MVKGCSVCKNKVPIFRLDQLAIEIIASSSKAQDLAFLLGKENNGMTCSWEILFSTPNNQVIPIDVNEKAWMA